MIGQKVYCGLLVGAEMALFKEHSKTAYKCTLYFIGQMWSAYLSTSEIAALLTSSKNCISWSDSFTCIVHMLGAQRWKSGFPP